MKNPYKNKKINLTKDKEEINLHPYKLPSDIFIYGKEDILRNNNIALKDGSENKMNNELICFSPKAEIEKPKIKIKKKIKRRKTTAKTNDVLDRKDSEEIKSKELIKNNLKDEKEVFRISNNNDLNDKNKELEGKRNKISKISFTWVDLYVCILCTRKRKNVKNILIDEGMELFSEKLDVINIFNQLIRVEKFEHVINELKPIEMSDECKLRLEKIKYSKTLV